MAKKEATNPNIVNQKNCSDDSVERKGKNVLLEGWLGVGGVCAWGYS